jgi:hypothetical protein
MEVDLQLRVLQKETSALLQAVTSGEPTVDVVCKLAIFTDEVMGNLSLYSEK